MPNSCGRRSWLKSGFQRQPLHVYRKGRLLDRKYSNITSRCAARPSISRANLSDSFGSHVLAQALPWRSDAAIVGVVQLLLAKDGVDINAKDKRSR